MNKTEVVLFRCDHQFKNRLDELVAESGKTKSEFIRECIKNGDEIVFKQKLAQINIKPANKNDMDGAFSNLTHALEKVIRVDDIPKELVVRLEDLILDFQLIRLKEAKKQLLYIQKNIDIQRFTCIYKKVAIFEAVVCNYMYFKKDQRIIVTFLYIRIVAFISALSCIYILRIELNCYCRMIYMVNQSFAFRAKHNPLNCN